MKEHIMTTKSRAEAKAEEKVEQKVEQHETKPATEHDERKAAKEAEEAQEESRERVAALNAPGGEAGLPVEENAIRQPEIPLPSTSVDRHGVERVMDGTDRDGWVPAPVDPHPTQVEEAKKRNAALDEKLAATQKAAAKAAKHSED